MRFPHNFYYAGSHPAQKKNNFQIKHILKMKKLFIIFSVMIALAFSIAANAQLLPVRQWVSTFNNPNPLRPNDRIVKTIVTNNGSAFSLINNDSAGGLHTVSIVKYSPAGTQLWLRNFSTNYYGAGRYIKGLSIASDTAGNNIYVYGNIDFGLPLNKTFLVKYNSMGDSLWTRYLTTPDSSYQLAELYLGQDYQAFDFMKVDNAGNIYVSRYEARYMPQPTVFRIGVTRLDPSGGISWEWSQMVPGFSGGSRMVLDNNNNVYMAGVKTTGGNADYMVLKLSSGGALQWLSTYDGPTVKGDYASTLALDAAGNAYVTGVSGNSNNTSDIATVKFDGASGGFMWVNRIPAGSSGSHVPGSVLVTPSGDVYAAGSLSSNIPPYFSGFLQRLNPSTGTEIWRRPAPFTPGYHYQYNRTLGTDNSGNIYTAGDQFSIYYILKYNPAGDIQWHETYNNGQGVINTIKWMYVRSDNSIILSGDIAGSSSDVMLVKYAQLTGQYSTVSKSVNLPINDFEWTRDTINVSLEPGASILRAEIRVDSLVHPYVKNLIGIIKSPSGTEDTLFRRPGPNMPGSDFINCTFSDTARRNIDTAAATYTGYYKSRNSLANMNGLSPNGKWVLSIYDSAMIFTGTLKKWSVIVTYHTPVGIIKQTEIASEFSLSQNYPNPFNPVTNIKFSIPQSGDVTLKVYDMLGKQVAELVNGYKPSGSYIVDFNGSNLPSGVYFYRLEAKDFTDVKKMVLVK